MSIHYTPGTPGSHNFIKEDAITKCILQIKKMRLKRGQISDEVVILNPKYSHSRGLDPNNPTTML